MESRVTAIIAAKNEAGRIGRVLKVVCGHPLVDEIITVVNGSTDRTEEVAATFNTKVINHPGEIGKTLAVKDGLEKATGDYILLLDADLVGLTQDDITKLLRPVLDGKVDFTMSLRGNSIMMFKLMKCEFITGERVMKKSLLTDPFIWARPEVGYGLEVRMNESLLKHKRTFCSVYLKDVGITYKARKDGLLSGIKQEINMWFIQLPKALSLIKVFLQAIRMNQPTQYEDLYPAPEPLLEAAE